MGSVVSSGLLAEDKAVNDADVSLSIIGCTLTGAMMPRRSTPSSSFGGFFAFLEHRFLGREHASIGAMGAWGVVGG